MNIEELKAYIEANKEHFRKTGYSRFNETWLFEMPIRLGPYGNPFEILKGTVEGWIKGGRKPQQLSNHLFIIEGGEIMYYWWQIDNEFAIIVELDKKPQGYFVTMVGKNPKFMKNPPYATDLYLEILNHIPQPLLFSDRQLSDDGIEIWKRLIQDPSNVISVYNTAGTQPAHSFINLTSPDQLDAYLGAEHEHNRFVLSKKSGQFLDMHALFRTRKFKESIPGIILHD